MKINLYIIIFLNLGFQNYSYSQDTLDSPIREYWLTIDEKTVNFTGKEVMGMAVNGSIPGPILEFIEGEQAVIHVTNTMNMETSVHWHGILLPNFQDGVPYLTTPPIMPGTTFTYHFPIKQAGTYWYHSHTMLQEQSGVFGSIVIQPKEKSLVYNKELVLMLSDWTNEDPHDVMRTLKRGSDWYGIKKGTSTPLNKVIARGALGAQIDFWRQRMEGADIADIYYPAFLINGKQVAEYTNFKPGDKVRLRIINGSSSTQFWMTFGGEIPLLVSADGLNVVPVKRNKTFIAIAETYDFIVTIPQRGKLEFRAMAQDGSGTTFAYFGSGEILPAPIVEKPDKIAMMQEMANMKMKMGAHAIKFQPKKDERFEMKAEYEMKMDHSKMEMAKDSAKMDHSKMDHSKMDHSKMEMAKDSVKTDHSKMDHSKMEMVSMEMDSEYNYNYLKSPIKTNYAPNIPVTEILLNLTGNMNRYIWSMNGVPLSETDFITIKGNEVTRITLNNLTMMHHPMHLHGHFFRVLNENGEYSPLKHTVNVPPMQQITIEFYGDAYGDWMFHCHVLYHMMGGMSRVFSYNTPRDERMLKYPVSKLINEANHYYAWGTADVASNRVGLKLTASNLRNQFNLKAVYGWNQNIEAEGTYERYLHDNLRVFGGLTVENKQEDSLDEFETTAVAGIRYLTPYLFQMDVRIDHKLRPQIGVERELLVFPRTFVFGMIEYQADFGLVDELPLGIDYSDALTWNAGLEYLLSKSFSLKASYDNRFGAGGGLSIQF